ncbi:MAG: hypothetical protein RLZZ387_512 [Chloroflexota bacterium]|jgi:hypothetical protein
MAAHVTPATFVSDDAAVFDALSHPLHMRRIGGGSETDVYAAEGAGYVVKFKRDLSGSPERVLAHALRHRAVSELFAAYLGDEHAITSAYVVVGDEQGRAQLLVVQPFLGDAQQLASVKYGELSSQERQVIARQLRDLVRRALRCWRATGHLPDLHGTHSVSAAERRWLNTAAAAPRRIWRFVAREHLLRSHNLLLAGGPEPHVVLVDYDPVRWRSPLRALYHAARWVLFWRDDWLIRRLERSP